MLLSIRFNKTVVFTYLGKTGYVEPEFAGKDLQHLIQKIHEIPEGGTLSLEEARTLVQ